MLKDDVDYTCEVVLKTAQETGESVGIIHESLGNREKLGGGIREN